MDNLYSSAFNQQNFISGGPDSRTGLVSKSVTLAKLSGNGGLGPDFELALGFDPMGSMDAANGVGSMRLGRGWSFNLGGYSAASKQLTLSTKQSYKVVDAGWTLSHKQLDLKVQESDDKKHLYVIHKEGLVEVHDFEGNNPEESNAHLTRLIQDDGRALNFHYKPMEGQFLLDRISNDDDQALVIIDYDDSHQIAITLFPDTSEEKQFQLAIDGNACLTRLILPDHSAFEFSYEQQNGNSSGNMYFLSEISSPTGQTEEMHYTSPEKGHRLPNGAPVDYLPVIYDYIVDPGAGQPKVLTRFDFRKDFGDNNFLGFGPVESWNSQADNLWDVDRDYRYGSTVTVDPNGDSPKVQTNVFNKLHQVLEQTETYDGGDHIKTTTYEYYSDNAAVLDDQPLQYEQQKSRTIAFTAGQQNRSFKETSAYDESGNQLNKTDFSGVSESYSYYLAEGESLNNETLCPKDPYGFIRQVKNYTRTPAAIEGDGNAVPVSIDYHYIALPALTSGGAASQYITKSLELREGLGKVEYSYINDTSDYNRHGLQASQVQTLSDLTTTTEYSYSVDGNNQTETQTVTGHDDETLSIETTISCLTGKTLKEKNAQQVVTAYSYDLLGRLATEVVAPDTDYEAKRTYEYVFATESTPATMTTTDANGLKARATYDGLSRIVQVECQDEDGEFDGGGYTGTFRKLRESSYNVLGQLVTENRYDWLNAKEQGQAPVQITSGKSYEYDAWGKTAVTEYSDGHRELSGVDPFALTDLTGIEGEGLTRTTRDLFKNPVKIERFASEADLEAEKSVSVASYDYDGFGRKISETDTLGYTTAYEYDTLNRVVNITRPDGSVQETAYADHSTEVLPVSVKVAGTEFGTQGFDGLGRVTESVVAGRKSINTYGAGSDKPATLETPTGDKLTFDYCPDLGNSLIQITVGEEEHSFDYDKQSSLLTTVYSAAQGRDIEHGVSGLLKTEIYNKGASDEKTASYLFSQGGKLQSFTDVLNGTHQFGYDDQGRLTSILQDNLKAAVSYDGSGRPSEVTVTDQNQDKVLKTTLGYDAFGREISRNQIITGQSDRTLTMTYDLNDQLLTRTLKSGETVLRDESFGYDSNRRLISYSCSGSEQPLDALGKAIDSQTFSYDQWNNITSCTTVFEGGSNTAAFSYTGSDPTQLISIANSHSDYPAIAELEYDEAGRMVKDDQGRQLDYDSLGRLVKITHSDSKETLYRYDGQGQLVEQTLANGDLLARYYRDGSVVNEKIGGDGFTYFVSGSQILAARKEDSGETRLFGLDKDGTVTAELDTISGELRDRPYTAYGEQAVDANLSQPGFNGELKDQDTGWYLLGNGYRAYNPSLMRFNTPDSMSPFSGGGINPYAYCLGNPVNRMDPSGHFSMSAGADLGLNIFCLLVDLAMLAAATASIVASGGTALAALGVAGAVFGITSDTLGIAADSMTIQDQKQGWDRSDTEQNLGFASGIFGVASLVAGVGEAAGGMAKVTKSKMVAKSQARAVRSVVAGLDDMNPKVVSKSMKLSSGAEMTAEMPAKGRSFSKQLADPVKGFFGDGAFDDLTDLVKTKPVPWIIAPALTISTLASAGLLFGNTTWKPASKNDQQDSSDQQQKQSSQLTSQAANPFAVAGQSVRTPVAIEIANS